jgi:hypothetical protein
MPSVPVIAILVAGCCARVRSHLLAELMRYCIVKLMTSRCSTGDPVVVHALKVTRRRRMKYP